MNPEMMRQMMARLAEARATDPSNGDGRESYPGYPFLGDRQRYMGMGEQGPSRFGSGQRYMGMGEQGVNPMSARSSDPARGDATSLIEDILDMIRGMGGEYDGPVRPNPADAPARDPYGNKLTPTGKVGPTEVESRGKDAAMLNRAREMARRAAMQRILSSEDIPPSPTR